jgi:hypothetical protein
VPAADRPGVKPTSLLSLIDNYASQRYMAGLDIGAGTPGWTLHEAEARELRARIAEQLAAAPEASSAAIERLAIAAMSLRSARRRIASEGANPGRAADLRRVDTAMTMIERAREILGGAAPPREPRTWAARPLVDDPPEDLRAVKTGEHGEVYRRDPNNPDRWISARGVAERWELLREVDLIEVFE